MHIFYAYYHVMDIYFMDSIVLLYNIYFSGQYTFTGIYIYTGKIIFYWII